ncbi:Nucleosome assembly protein 1;2 [Linum grandiflorum]
MAAEGARNEVDAVVNQLKELKLQQRLEGLDSKERRRTECLREIQSYHDQLESQLFRDMNALEYKYQQRYKPFHIQREDIVNGTVGASSDSEVAPEAIPKFWLLAMKKNNVLSKKIKAKDEEALMMLKDIKCSRLLDEGNQPECSNKGFRLDFYFHPKNPYFENSVLSKTYHMTYELSNYNEPLVENAVGTEIKWHPGKNLTQKANKDNTKEKDCASFFNFFKPPQIPHNFAEREEDELHEDDAYSLHNDMERDYDMGCTFRDKIIPRAVSWYTGEAAVWADDEDDDEDDDDDDDEDEEGNDASDDEEGNNNANEEQEQEEEEGDDEEEEEEDKDEDEDEEDDDEDEVIKDMKVSAAEVN